jgi:vacuolar-type H+-ATPase subunit H
LCLAVASLSELLHRFRRLGVPPGPPAAALGVPARAGEALAAELLPVFAAVDVIASDARAIFESAEPQAQETIAAGRQEAARIRQDGVRRAERERAAVAASHERSSQAELSRIAAEAEREVSRIGEVAAARRAGLASRVVDRLRGVS